MTVVFKATTQPEVHFICEGQGVKNVNLCGQRDETLNHCDLSLDNAVIPPIKQWLLQWLSKERSDEVVEQYSVILHILGGVSTMLDRILFNLAVSPMILL